MSVSQQAIDILRQVVEDAGGTWEGLQKPLEGSVHDIIFWIGDHRFSAALDLGINTKAVDVLNVGTMVVKQAINKRGNMSTSPAAPAVKLSLKEKLWQIYATVEGIEKRGYNKAQSYWYLMASDVTKAVREQLTALRVYAEINFDFVGESYTIARAKDPNAPFTAERVKCTIVFHDLDSADILASSGLGTGADTGDKAAYKAQTGALKYALKNAVLAPDDEHADPEADEQIDEGGEPDFQSARREQPKPSKQKTEKPAQAKAAAPAEPPAKNETKPTPASSTAPAASTKPAKPAAAPSTTSAAPAAVLDVLPTEEQLTKYRAQFSKLGDDLSTEGKLKASRGLPVNRKLLVFLLHVTQAPDPKDILVGQWEDFFRRVEGIRAQGGGLIALAKKVNTANGIEDKK